MAEATDQQMQTYADARIRPRAETLRDAINALRDDKAANNETYLRASVGTPWNDDRTDGPPKLLASNDHLVYNAVITALLACVDGTATLGDVATLHSNWAAFQEACVRPVGV